ncbi:hypothetical protein BCR35DRAFT_328858 [Leucosporidium creatinivorum]|uniref:F-box domain-containing protein n=1 Tax=Leucosporidium creatinivorum TaxID=106004 RepID=A0A1Y2G0R4_9BASI|nr:hypothetical protein BCR35DRAFT_328858 [Leucosporidium creatinivorum]
MPLPSLPNEILAAIAELVEDLADIRCLRLVSRAWAGAAHPQLFRRLTYRHYNSVNKAARVVVARPAFAFAVKEIDVELAGEDEDWHAEVKKLFSLCANVFKISISPGDTPLLALATLESAISSKLRELYFWGTLRTPEELVAFASYFNTCPNLSRLGLEGVQIEGLDDLGDDQTGIALLKQSSTRHSLNALSLGAHDPSCIFKLLTSRSHTSLRDLHLELRDEHSEESDPLDLSPFTSLRELHLWRYVDEEFDYGDPDVGAITFLQRCNAPPSLRHLSLELNPDKKFGLDGNDYRIWRYLESGSLLQAIPRSVSTLSVDGVMSETDDVVNYLKSLARSPTLTSLKLNIYKRPASTYSHVAVARECRLLGIRSRLSPFDLVLSGVDVDEDQENGSDCSELEGPWEELVWDGGY